MQVCRDAQSRARLIHRYLAEVEFIKFDGTPVGRVLYTRRFYQVQWKNLIRDFQNTQARSLIPKLGYVLASLILFKLGFADSGLKFAVAGALAFDASSGNQKSGGGSTLSWTHTCSGSDRILIGGAITDLLPDYDQNMTYASVSMTELGQQAAANEGGNSAGDVEYFYLIGPASGANTAEITMGLADTCIGVMASYTGGNAVNNFTSGNGIGTSASVTVTSATGNLVVGILGHNEPGGTETIDSGNEREDRSVASQWSGSLGDQSGSSSVTHSWTLGGTYGWALCAANVVAGSQAITKELTEVVTIVDTVLKQDSRILSEIITIVDSITTAKIFVVLASEVITVTDTLLKTATKVLSETVTIVDSIIKTSSRVFSEVVTIVDTVIKQVSRTFSESISLVAQLIIALNGSVIQNIWSLLTKNTNTWTMTGKNDNTWANRAKNTNDWTMRDKTPGI